MYKNNIEVYMNNNKDLQNNINNGQQNNQRFQETAWVHPDDLNNNLNSYNSYTNFNYNQNKHKKNNTTNIIIIVVLVAVAAFLLPRIIFFLVSFKSTNSLLNDTRKSSYCDNIFVAVQSIRTDYLTNGYDEDKCYNLEKINRIKGEKPLISSPFGANYSKSSYIIAKNPSNSKYIYPSHIEVCFADEKGYGVSNINVNDLTKDNITTNISCTLPLNCN